MVGSHTSLDGCWNTLQNGCVADGSTDDRAALNTLANTTIPSTGGVICFAPGTYRLASNMTFPAWVTLSFAQGAMLSPASGTAVTINGQIIASGYQIFTGSGAIALSNVIAAVLPQWFGQKADCVVVTDAAMTISTKTLVSASSNFTAADVRKVVYVHGAGTGGASLRSTIRAIISTTSVILANSAVATVSGATCVYGSDNTSLFNKMIAAVPAGATIAVAGGTFWFPGSFSAGGGPLITATKSIKMFGLGTATFKFGPEQPGAPSAALSTTFVGIQFATNTDSVIEGINFEGPERNNGRWFRPLYAWGLVSGTGRLKLRRVNISKGTTAMKTDPGAYAWATAMAYFPTQSVRSNGNLYSTVAGGTSGVTPPSGTGTMSDGGVTWTYIRAASIGQEIWIEDCQWDTAADGTAAVQDPTFKSAEGTVFYVTNSTFQNHSGSYAWYPADGSDILAVNSTFGPVEGQTCVYPHGGSNPSGASLSTGTAARFQKFVNCQFLHTGPRTLGGGAFNGGVVSLVQFENCLFQGENGNDALFVGASTVLTNCIIKSTTGRGVQFVDSIHSGSVVRFIGCVFDEVYVALSYNSVNTINVLFEGCAVWAKTAGVGASWLTVLAAGVTVTLRNCELWGKASLTDGLMVLYYATEVRVESNQFYNSGMARAIYCPDTSGVSSFFMDDGNLWEDPTVAFGFGAGTVAFAKGGLRLRNGVSPVTVDSAPEIVLNWNYNTYRITGTTTIARIKLQSAGFSGMPTLGIDGEIRLIPEGAFALASGNNILTPNTSASIVNSGRAFRYIPALGEWIELTQAGGERSGVTGAVSTASTVTHGLGITPTSVTVTDLNATPVAIGVTSIGDATFTINFAGGGTRTVMWMARV